MAQIPNVDVKVKLDKTSIRHISDLVFCKWLREEFKAGNQGMDIDNNTLPAEDALKLLKKIKQKFSGIA